jgi:hypothetical protein
MMYLPPFLHAQMPTHVDPGQHEESVNVWEDPYYLLPIVLLLALLILYFWTRKKK